MSPSDLDPENADVATDPDAADPDAADAEAPQREPLTLDVKIAQPSACQRHITVTIPREDIDRYFGKAFDELMPSATVPGFRAGRAPRKLVEHRFRKDVVEQVKSSLVMDSLAQITEDHKLSAISEPDFDLEAVEVPEEGPLTYEFDLEVRPGIRSAAVEGSVDSPADARDQQRRRAEAIGAGAWPARAAGAVRRAGRGGRSYHREFTFLDGEHVVSEHPEEAMRLAAVLSFRDGRSRTSAGDGGRASRRNAIVARADFRGGRGIGSRFEAHGAVRGAGSQEARASGTDARVAAGTGRLRFGRRASRCPAATN